MHETLPAAADPKAIMAADSPPSMSERVFWTFRADDRLYGMDVRAMREVSTNNIISPVPHAPLAIRGLINLRSHILLVLDLRPLLGLPVVELAAESRLVILKSTVLEDAAILVDRGCDIVRVAQDRIESAEPSLQLRDGDHPQLIAGVCKLDNELMMIVDATRIAALMRSIMR